ncbi:MAG: hypothetical protein HF962_06985 [Sulfurovum sp.]|nr:hypothetical protein [Sulfurovum sp.]
MIFYSIGFMAALFTAIVGIVSMADFSLGALGFLFWAVSPYIFAAYLLKKSTGNVAVTFTSLLSLVVALGGISLLLYAMYIEKDAQSALAFVVIPTYQWGLLLLSTLVLYLINKKYKGTK